MVELLLTTATLSDNVLVTLSASRCGSKRCRQLCIPPVLKGREERLILQNFGEYKGWKMQSCASIKCYCWPCALSGETRSVSPISLASETMMISVELHALWMIIFGNETIVKNRTIMSSEWSLDWWSLRYLMHVFSSLIINIYLIELLQLPWSTCRLWYLSGLAIFLEASVDFSFLGDISLLLFLSPWTILTNCSSEEPIPLNLKAGIVFALS